MIRNALIDDIDFIEEIEKSSFETPWSRVSLEVEFYKDYSKMFIYEIDNIIVGYIIIWDLGKEWELVTLAVSKEYRRMKIGTKLLEYALKLSDSNSIWRLEVDCKNKEAISLYKKYNFNIVGEISNYYGQYKNAYRMLRHTNVV